MFPSFPRFMLPRMTPPKISSFHRTQHIVTTPVHSSLVFRRWSKLLKLTGRDPLQIARTVAQKLAVFVRSRGTQLRLGP